MKPKHTLETYFRRYVANSPLGLSIWRAVEAKHLSTILLKRPILDIGCGFGEFAQAFFDEPADMGLDIAPLDLYGASKTRKYRHLLLADARHIPLSSESFNTIISISTLEHIPQPDRVLRESYRLLRPNGRIVFTMETSKVVQGGAFRDIFNKIGLSRLSDMYERKFNEHFNRQTLISKEMWLKKIQNAGFTIETAKDIISPKITKLFDIFLLTAWPSQLLKPLLGRRLVYRPKIVSDILVKFFLRFMKDSDTNGTNLFVVARRPASSNVKRRFNK